MNEPSSPRSGPARLGEYLRYRLSLFSDDLMIGAIILIALIAFMLPAMIVTIPAGHLGVKWKRFGGGTVLNEPLSEGTSMILPWDRVSIYDARLQNVDREFEVLSSDGLKLTIDLSWRYRIIPNVLGDLHQYAGPNYAETLLAPSVGARARDVIAIYRPEDIYTSHRLEIQNQISESVRYDLKHRFAPTGTTPKEWIVLEDVLVKRIVLPDGVEESIVRKNMARHEVEQYALIVEKELRETERKRVEALGIRNFQEIVSEGMSESYLRWRGIEATLELARSNNAKVVVVGNNKTGGLPIISISGDTVQAEDPKRGKQKTIDSGRADASDLNHSSTLKTELTKPVSSKPAESRESEGKAGATKSKDLALNMPGANETPTAIEKSASAVSSAK
ncbi:prohibitin family protein [Noviherbaspirillum sp. CPCC 100848]|uniref:Prohibitin family protein n=1 Tax=Noviherbaspirillum album TaxID=3080276 RepID=A0ABU6JAM8_9BURK|nr:prohibitin family protein [Noviherbaspirillum sp. CPCC 100848]MEC4720701.1 prohibitin family protein [Noviherbaspirillum sp. CPCC 100848]